MVCMLFNLPNLTDRAHMLLPGYFFQTTTLNSSPLKKAAMDWTTCLVMPIYAPSVRHAMCGVSTMPGILHKGSSAASGS